MTRIINPANFALSDQDTKFPRPHLFFRRFQNLARSVWGTRYFVYFPWKRVDRLLARKMSFGFSAVGAIFGALGRFASGAARGRDDFVSLLIGIVFLHESGGDFVVGSYGGGMVASSFRNNGGSSWSCVTG
jgi:hypothetical protein